jgi:hypothetical protein
MSMRTLSIEIFRDIETPGISIDAAIEGLEEVRGIIGSLVIVARNGLLRLSKPDKDIIRTNKIPPLDIETDFGIILTGRRIIMPSKKRLPISKGNITVGLTVHTKQGSDFALIDALNSRSVRGSTMHEKGHLLGIPNGGEDFDGFCHCRRRDCVMHSQILYRVEQTDYCDSCQYQLAKSAMTLMHV